MTDMIQNLTWRYLWNEYIYEGIKKGAKREDIRRNLVEAFRKEIFGEMMFQMKVGDLRNVPETPGNLEVVRNIMINKKKKWARLVKECEKFPQTRGLIRQKDLTLEDDQEAEEQEEEPTIEFEETEDPEEDYESPWSGDEQTDTE